MEVKYVVEELNRHPDGTFLDLTQFNDTTIGSCRIIGESPVWEMHPDTDELFHIIDGELSITLLEDNGAKTYSAMAGSMFVVPKGIWHKPSALSGVTFVYLTPGQSLHSDLDDPRGSA